MKWLMQSNEVIKVVFLSFSFVSDILGNIYYIIIRFKILWETKKKKKQNFCAKIWISGIQGAFIGLWRCKDTNIHSFLHLIWQSMDGKPGKSDILVVSSTIHLLLQRLYDLKKKKTFYFADFFAWFSFRYIKVVSEIPKTS